jgi:hypothetical protein
MAEPATQYADTSSEDDGYAHTAPLRRGERPTCVRIIGPPGAPSGAEARLRRRRPYGAARVTGCSASGRCRSPGGDLPGARGQAGRTARHHVPGGHGVALRPLGPFDPARAVYLPTVRCGPCAGALMRAR